MPLRAVFFDRDNTLTGGVSTFQNAFREKVEGWSGRPYHMDYEKMMALFDQAGYPEHGHKSVESEEAFWKRYYHCLLQNEGVVDGLEEKALELHQFTWLKGRGLYPEVTEVLGYFKSKGCKLGVISDTGPSLPLTLEALGVGHYFDCFICSDLVGVMKPDPRIYQAGLDALGVTACESLYVDDYDVEADGARAMGFTAFHIVRGGEAAAPWDITSLKELIPYCEKERLL